MIVIGILNSGGYNINSIRFALKRLNYNNVIIKIPAAISKKSIIIIQHPFCFATKLANLLAPLANLESNLSKSSCNKSSCLFCSSIILPVS